MNIQVNQSFKSRVLPIFFIVTLFLCLSWAFSILVIQDLSTPLTGRAGPGKVDNWDYVDNWEYIGFYFAKNFRFFPLPHLELVNNQVFYPYGTNSVFQGWGIERDGFYALFYTLFGIGPWLQLYYFLTVLITAIGTLILLIQDYGWMRATGAGFIVSFFNFYAIHKYPHHLNQAIAHWTTLNIVADFLLVKRVVLRQSISLRLILLRACLLILLFGQDLGYITGFGLMSFSISILFIFILQGYRYLRQEFRLIELLSNIFTTYKAEFLTHCRISLFLIVLILTAIYIYIPLVFQIAIVAKKLEFTEIFSGGWWTNPLRLLIPFFPFLNPKFPLEKIFVDSPEGLGAGSPGWFLLILGALGFWQARKRLTIFVPLLLVFLLCLLYHPSFFPTIRIFPWFSFNRVGGRNTIIYPVILCIFALHINLNNWRWRSRQLVTSLLVFLACTELYTAYFLTLDYHPVSLNKNFFSYMNYLKQQPGEAVLDWPFCAIGGNGVSGGLCPYYNLNSGVYTMRRFHEKKVMGQYFGRLNPSQIEPYLQAGWDKLLLPDSRDLAKESPQVHCFRPDEWSFFTDFYKLNDFAGINLYLNLLPDDCMAEFYKRLGKPVAEAIVPGPGRVQFIPKSPELKSQVNLTLGTKLKFEAPLNFSESNLLEVNSPYSLTLTGLESIEKDDKNGKFRWGLAPETMISFRLPESQPLEVKIKFENLLEGQNIKIQFNHNEETIFNIKTGEIIERKLKLSGITGLNKMIINYEKIMPFNDMLMAVIKYQGIAGLNPNNLRQKVRDWRKKRVIKFKELVISVAQ
ncbi:MAG TPA: hypothetical protein V6D11_23880 [Waterburya sp.]|jgi:hypothetical protein